MESTPLTVHQIVALMRTQAGKTQAEVAEELGIHKNSVANMERGRQDPIPWMRELEKVTGKPEGWADAFVDPLSFIMRQQEDIDHIRQTVDEILELLKPVRDGTVRKRR